MDTKQTLISSEHLVLDAASAILKDSLAAVMCYLPQAVKRKKDDAERVHELRVSTRRVTAALDLFEEFVPRRATRRLIRKLTILRQVAGSARDCDVFSTRFSEWMTGDVAIPLANELQQWRVEAQQSLVDLYHKWDEGDRLERRVTQVMCDIRPRGEQATRDGTTFGRFARRRLREIVRRFFAGNKTDAKTLKRLHAFRIRVKRLRYCLELLQPGLPEEPVRAAHKTLRKLSQRLGHITDHATAVALLTQWRNENSNRAAVELLELLRTKERKALRKAAAAFREWWTPKRRRRVHRRLKRIYRDCQTAA